MARGSAVSLAGVAATGLTTAGALGSVELAGLAAAGALVACAHAWRLRRGLRAHRGVVAHLGGGRAVRSRAGWCSRDGARRVRRSDDGALVFEELCAEGTLRACRGRLPGLRGELIAPPAARELVGVFALHGRALRPTCFVGLPEALGGCPRHVPAAFVRMEVGAEDVRLVRLDAHRRDVGETVHATRSAAERQLAWEYGTHLGPRVRGAEAAAGVSWEGGGSARPRL